MGSIGRRLGRLEERTGDTDAERWPRPTATLYLKRLENIERAERGEEPIPLTPEEEAAGHDPEFDAWWADFLALHDEDGRSRASPEEHREMTDRWHEMRRRKYGFTRRTR